MSTSEGATVLVVDDEPAVVDGHGARLAERYEVRRAHGGEEALAKLDEAVDVVLLDRRMPGLSGDEVLEQLRERGLDCRVVMLTAVEPAFDIVDMGFDDYLQKPVSEAELFETVEAMLRRGAYETKLQEYFALASKKAVLETEHDPDVLADSREYRDLRKRLDRLEDEVDEALAALSPDDGYAVAADRN